MADRVCTPAPEWIKLSDVEREAERLSAGGFVWPQLSSLLEGKFHADRAPGRRHELNFGGLIILAIFNLLLISDYVVTPHLLLHAFVVRFGLVTPLVLLSMLIPCKRRVLLQECWAVGLCAIAVAASLLLRHNVNDASSLQATAGMLLVTLAMNTLLRPDILLSVLGTALCYGECLVFLAAEDRLTLTHKSSIACCALAFALLSLAANYTLAREQRLSWLQQIRGRIQQRMLTESNRELTNMSFTDPLTGLPNRAAYEKRLAELWQHACLARDTLAVIMVDVDHFKSVNDTFGHLYGDRVLQRIGNLLEEAMRVEADFVARFGGEEFVALLPGTSMESAAQVAERIRTLVQVAGSPAPIRGEGPLPSNVRWSTVSCGVAAVQPRPGDSPSGLVHAADLALYTAKQTGRNRVCMSPQVISPILTPLPVYASAPVPAGTH